jgi:hypothetical protein
VEWDGNATIRGDDFYLIAAGALYRIPLNDPVQAVSLGSLPAGMDKTWGAVYHQPSDKLVFWGGTGVVFTYDPLMNAWERFESPGPTVAGSQGVYSKWDHLTAHDVFIAYNNADEGVWLWKPTSGAVPEPTPPPAGSASFQERCTDPAVILCDPIGAGRVSGVAINENTPCATLAEAMGCRYGDWRTVTPSPYPEGNPVAPGFDVAKDALKFTIPTNSDANDSGYFQTNFTPDGSVQFGEGQTFFVQWRQRFSYDMLFDENGNRRRYAGEWPGGFKIVIVGSGDAGGQISSSCTDLEIVFNNSLQHGSIKGYHNCGWYAPFELDAGTVNGGSQFDLQPGGSNVCWYADPVTGTPLNEAWGDCEMFWPDEWMTFQIQVTIGQWTTDLNDPAKSSNIKLWVAREGQPSRLIFDYDLNLHPPEAPFVGYGKVWLLPYHTAKDPAEVHPEAYTWYDELIVSRQRIADPG